MAKHVQYYKENIESGTLVVFIHGFMGSPNQMEPFCRAVEKTGCSVLSLLLPGHGGTGRDFANSRLCDWENHVLDTVARYAKNHYRVILVGHSMGGLLSLNASLKIGKVCGVVLLSSPIYIKVATRGITNFMKLLFFTDSSPASRKIVKAYRDGFGVTPSPVTVFPLWLRQVNELRRLIVKTRRNFEKFTVPVLIIQSKNDETVQFRSGRVFERKLVNANRRRVVLKDSWHAYFTEKEKRIIIREILKFIARVG